MAWILFRLALFMEDDEDDDDDAIVLLLLLELLGDMITSYVIMIE
jgi:hypothetical protein